MPQNPLDWSVNVLRVNSLLLDGSALNGMSALVAKQNFLAPLPGDTTSSTPSLVTQVTPTNVALTIAAQPPQARKLIVQMHIGTTTTTAVTAGTCTLVYVDQDGDSVTDVIALACTATTVFKSRRACAQLTSATVAGYVASGSGTGNTIAIGQSNDFGVSTGGRVANFALVKSTKIITTVTGAVTGWARAVSDDNAAGATVDAVARTVAPTTAPGVAGINDYEFTVSYTLGS
jgi:hypothetical protein